MERIKSRKLWITVLTAALIAFGEEIGLNLDERDMMYLVGLVLGYLGIQGVADVKKAAKPAVPSPLSVTMEDLEELNAATSVH